jgi:hypothetical protein
MLDCIDASWICHCIWNKACAIIRDTVDVPVVFVPIFFQCIGGVVNTTRKLLVLLLGMFVLMLTSLALAQAPKPPASVVLPAVNGAVTFDHAAHVKVGKCADCHHASKPQKPSKGFEKCGDCHTKAGAAPVTTKLQAAFHNPTATAGTCIDCHKKQVAAGKKAPAKCADCHKKA